MTKSGGYIFAYPIFGVCNDENNSDNFFIFMLSKVVIRCRKKKPGIKGGHRVLL